MPLNPYSPAWTARWLGRPFIRHTFRPIFRLLSPVRITGLENIPRRQAYIAAFNHVSLYDPPFVGAFWPEQMEIMGAVDIWSKPGQNILVRLWDAIPVHRGEVDRALFTTVLNVLASGYPVLIAPEGGRSHKPGLRPAKPGVAYLAEQSGVPVVPVGIVGTTDDYWHNAARGRRPALELHVGRPIHLPSVEDGGSARREVRQANADRIMRHIAGLLPEEYRGVYTAAPIFQDGVIG